METDLETNSRRKIWLGRTAEMEEEASRVKQKRYCFRRGYMAQ